MFRLRKKVENLEKQIRQLQCPHGFISYQISHCGSDSQIVGKCFSCEKVITLKILDCTNQVMNKKVKDIIEYFQARAKDGE